MTFSPPALLHNKRVRSRRAAALSTVAAHSPVINYNPDSTTKKIKGFKLLICSGSRLLHKMRQLHKGGGQGERSLTKKTLGGTPKLPERSDDLMEKRPQSDCGLNPDTIVGREASVLHLRPRL